VGPDSVRARVLPKRTELARAAMSQRESVARARRIGDDHRGRRRLRSRSLPTSVPRRGTGNPARGSLCSRSRSRPVWSTRLGLTRRPIRIGTSHRCAERTHRSHRTRLGSGSILATRRDGKPGSHERHANATGFPILVEKMTERTHGAGREEAIRRSRSSPKTPWPMSVSWSRLGPTPSVVRVTLFVEYFAQANSPTGDSTIPNLIT
jgi:hypothetical protein